MISTATKETIKRFISKGMYRILRGLGGSNQRAFRLIGHRIAQTQWGEAARRSKSSVICDPTRTGQRIVIFAMIGNMYLTRMELALAMSLQARGANVELYFCDGLRPLCEQTTIDQLERQPKRDICTKCVGSVRNLLSHAPWLRARYLSEIITPLRNAEIAADVDRLSLDEIRNFCVSGINLGKPVFQTLCRHLRVGQINDESATEKARQYLHSALITLEAAQTVAAEGPIDAVLMSHGIYASWAPALDYFRANDTYVVSYDRQARKNTLVFNANAPCRLGDISIPFNQRWRPRELSDSQRQTALDYLASRIDFSEDVMKLTFGPMVQKSEAVRVLRLNEQLPVFTLFANNLWDASSVDRDIVFDDVIDWIVSTIEFFRGRDNECQLVVRPHPAEAIRGTRQAVSDEIRKRFPTLPTNVRLLSADVDISSTSITQLTDVGIVHTSTVGMELAIGGKPVIVASQTHYRGIGFTIDPNSREEYFQALDECLNHAGPISHEQQELALKYFYVRFFKYCLDIPLYKYAENGTPRELAIDSFDRLQPGVFPDLDFVCDGILSQQGDFVQD